MAEAVVQRGVLFLYLTIILGLILQVFPLPQWADQLRPQWPLLILIYWSMALPERAGIFTALIVGLIVDGMLDDLLGQHALALCLVAFVTVRFHLLMRVFPLSQLTMTAFALLALYQFILFWINGVAGVSAPAVTYWGPVIVGTVAWPFMYMFLSGVRYRAQSGP